MPVFILLAEVSPEAAQQRQALQVFQLLPCLFRLCLAADPPVCTRHQKRQGLLLQHVRQGVHLSELEIQIEFNFKIWFTVAVTSNCVVFLSLFFISRRRTL